MIVTGVFDNEQDMEHALDELYRRGFNEDEVHQDEVHLITSDQITGWQNPALSVGSTGHVGGTAPGPTPLPLPGLLGSAPADPRDALVGLGVPESEAPFYAQNLRHGGVIVIVETSDEGRASEAREILRQANARTPTA